MRSAGEWGQTRSDRVSSPHRPMLSARQLVLAAVWLLVIAGIAATVSRPANLARDPLIPRHFINAHFDPPPAPEPLGSTLSHIWADLTSRSYTEMLPDLVPGQGAVLWLALIVALVVAFDFSRPTSARNLELAALLAIGFLLFNVMRFFDLLDDPVYFQVMEWVFGGIVGVSLFLLARAVWRTRRPHPHPWVPNLPRRALAVLAVLLLGLNVLVGLTMPPDDAGFYTNLGAQRLRERGQFPYGDPLLTNTAGAGYGPVLYLAHLPFQYVLEERRLNTGTFDKTDIAAGKLYRLPPPLATQVTTVLLHVIGVIALLVAARRMAGARAAWGIAALYCGSAYVLGVGGSREMIGGITFISHIAPAAFALMAFAALTRPFWSGALLVASIATVFFPILFVPAWLGHYWDRRRDAWRFAGGVMLAGLVLGLPVLALSQPLPGRSVLSTVLQESVGHHQGGDTYGRSTFGFWGQRGGLRSLIREPLVGGHFATSPMFVMTGAFAAATFFLARRSSPQQLALLLGALAIAAQVSKIHATAVYVTWYYPFLLLGFFATARPPSRADSAGDAAR
jgi:hypothetical protein